MERLSKSRVMTQPDAYFQDKRMLLDYQSQRLCHGLESSVASQRERFVRLAAALDAMSPLKVLGRGYSIAQKEDGAVLTSIQDAEAGEQISLRLADGSLCCQVNGRNKRSPG